MWTRLLRLPLIEAALTGPAFVWSVQRFLRRPISPDEARRILRTRLQNREADFLAVARRSIYANAGSPYRALLRLAGCEFGDLERLVRQQGLEGALSALCQQGVYLAVDEFKGRRPAVRGSETIVVAPERLLNPDSAYHILMQSSGSRGSRVRAPCDLAFIRDVGVYRLLGQTAQGGAD